MLSDYSKKYCIIGGGAIGIGIGKCLKQNNIDFDIIEKENDFGGNWYSGASCSKVYQTAHLISCKTHTQFSDFPMPAEYPDYPNHTLMLRYLRSMATHFKLYDNVEFNVHVIDIEFVDPYWKVKFSNQEEKVYKGIIIATGLLGEPNYSSYPGNFDGVIIHSRDYKSFEIFKDKRVLIIGGGNSGCDIAVDAALTAKNTFHSTRRGYHYMPKFIAGKPTQSWQMSLASEFKNPTEYWAFVKNTFKMAGFDGVDYGLPVPDHEIYQSHPIMNSQILYYIGHGDITPKPDIKAFEKNTVIFTDDSREEIDIIVYATGYQMSFPYIKKHYLSWRGNIPDLYLFTFHKHYDNLLFAGFVNSAAGLGNLVNSAGNMLSAYIQALNRNSKAIKIFQRVKMGVEPDLGNGLYLKSDRHHYEVDLWKLIKVLNNLRAKFDE